jgi:hypothetical protein
MSEAGGRIVLHREWSFMWAGSPKSKIRIDGAERGAVSNGGTLAIDVGAGEHSIQVAQGVIKRDLLVSVEAGQEAQIIESMSYYVYAAKMKLRLVRTLSSTIVETERYEITLGNDEVRSIDNLQGISPQVRAFRLAREWSKSYSIGSAQSITVSQGAEFSSKVADIKTKVERRVEQNYNMTSQQRQTFEDTLTVTAAPRTYSEIRITWKEIRQRGYVDEFDGAAHISRTPFELVVGLTYDPRQIDRHS